MATARTAAASSTRALRYKAMAIFKKKQQSTGSVSDDSSNSIGVGMAMVQQKRRWQQQTLAVA